MDKEKIIKMFKAGIVQRQIGKELNISSQYVNQLLHRYLPAIEIKKINKHNYELKRKRRIRKYVCPECGITKETIYIQRKFCSRKCMVNYQRKHLSQYNNKLRKIII